MKEMKTNGYKYSALPPVLFLCVMCSLLFAACTNPFDQDTPSQKIPPGMGALSLTIGKVNTRTIITDSSTVNFAVYTLEFYASGTLSKTWERTNTTFSDPVYLAAETYELRVTAYIDADKTMPAAKGTASITIVTSATASCTVDLKTIDDDGTGTFTWNITLPAGLDSASIRISPQDASGTTEETITLTFVNNESKLNTGTRELNAGYYLLTFNLSKPGTQSIIHRELLHVYQNLESILEFEFEDDHFNRAHYTVTFERNNGAVVLELDYWHGDTISKPADPTRNGYTFEGWYKDDNTFLNSWDFDTDTVTADITLYANWELDPGSAGITIPPVTDTTGPVIDLVDENSDPIDDDIILSRSGTGYPKTATIRVNAQTGWTVEWRYNNSVLGSSSTLTLNVNNVPSQTGYNAPYNIVGARHLLTVVVVTAQGVPYSKKIEFEVKP